MSVWCDRDWWVVRDGRVFGVTEIDGWSEMDECYGVTEIGGWSEMDECLV